MTGVHAARQKALLRRALAVDGVLTTAQLKRRGWLQAADRLGLPRVVYTCRTRVNQPESDMWLTFVGRDKEVLSQAPRELMHLAGLAEARSLVELAAGEEWRHVTLAGNVRMQLPDAEVVSPVKFQDAAVEFDAGYDRARRLKKLHGFAVGGYSRIFWMTSIHNRVKQVAQEAWMLHRRGDLPHVVGGEVVFVNFWSARDPYTGRPRCHKPFRQVFDFEGRADR